MYFRDAAYLRDFCLKDNGNLSRIQYLDFGSGIAVCGLGYSNERLKNAMKAQIDKLTHTSNLFYHEPGANAAEKLCKAAGMDRVFFTNSGAEAVEGALKLAKKYANKNGKQRFHNIIAMDNSFHGRTLGSVSVTGHEEYRTPFAPMIPKVIFAEYNDLESVKEIMNEETACVILETIQGEGGIYPASPDFIKGIRELCDKSGLSRKLIDRHRRYIIAVAEILKGDYPLLGDYIKD